MFSQTPKILIPRQAKGIGVQMARGARPTHGPAGVGVGVGVGSSRLPACIAAIPACTAASGAGSREFGAEPGAAARRPGARRVLVTRGEEAEAIWKCKWVAGFRPTLTARDVSALGAGRRGPGATSRRGARGGRGSRSGPMTFAPTPTACTGRGAACQLAQLPLSACSLPHPLTLVAGVTVGSQAQCRNGD